MPRFIKDRSKAKGEAPGSLIFIGKQKLEKPIIQLMQYNDKSVTEQEYEDIEQAYQAMQPDCVNWINVYGIHDEDFMSKLGSVFSLPRLLLEDILNTDQYPKFEDGDDFDAIIVKMMALAENTSRITTEQLSLIIGENYILTLQEQQGDVFASVRNRIRKKKGRIRSKTHDYLAYALLDPVVENYSSIVERLGRQVEELDDRIFRSSEKDLVSTIYKLKTELNYLRKATRPVRDIALQLLKSESSFFEAENKTYLSDLHGEVHQTIENVEFYTNLLSDQLNMHNTSIQNKQNEVMKVLTVFASIFIPLTFLAGIYGMNFKYLPELEYPFAYPVFWGVSLSIVGVLLLFFRRKRWL